MVWAFSLNCNIHGFVFHLGLPLICPFTRMQKPYLLTLAEGMGK